MLRVGFGAEVTVLDKRSIAVAYENGDGVFAFVRYNQIERTILINISNGNCS